MAMVDAHGLPIAICTASASPNEVTLVQLLFEFMLIVATPLKLVADKAYDSDRLDDQLQEQGTELIAPNRARRRQTQEGRPLAVTAPSLENRTLFRLVAVLSQGDHQVRLPHRQLPGLCPSRLRCHPYAVFMR